MIDGGFWRGRRVLVTGHTGFKGSWLSLWLARCGAQVTGLSLAPTTTARTLSSDRTACSRFTVPITVVANVSKGSR